MGTSSSTTQQQSSSQPGAAAMPTVNGLLGGVNNLLPNTGLNSQESSAISQLEGASNPFQAGTTSAINGLLGGGGATAQSGNVANNLANFNSEMNPLASNTNYNPMSTPGIGTQLSALNNNITNQINSQFAAGGRTGGGANTLSLATGLANGEAPILTNQYNQNVQNQQNAANSQFAGNNTSAQLQSGMTQQAAANQNTGLNDTSAALQNSIFGPSTALGAAQLGQSIPAQNLGMLASIGTPLAGLFTNQTGSGSGTNTASGIQDLTGILGGLGSIFGGNKSSDRRLKQDIKRVGTLDNGLPVYLYRYKAGGPFEIGLMAQDVEHVTPAAIGENGDGFKTVNYKMATEAA